MKNIILLIFALSSATLTIFGQVETYLRVKVFTPNAIDIRTLAEMGIALESLERKPGEFIVGEFSESEVKLIQKSGLSYEVIIPDMASFYVKRSASFSIKELNDNMKKQRRSISGYVTPENFSLGSMGGYHTYTELLAELDEMHTMFPNLISAKQPIGLSTTIEGRPVYWVRISNNPESDQQKTKILYTALTHAREPASMQQMLYQMWYLLENYSSNAEIKYLIDNLEMYFIPCVNPDGYIYNQTSNPNGGGMWRKNRRLNSGGSMGVDLNRNFGYNWGYDNSGSSPDGTSLTYRGTGPFSEPETQLVKQFAEAKNFDLALNNHTYSDILIYPWGYANITTPDAATFQTFAELMTQENGYTYGTCYQTLSYTANGGSDDWFYGEQLTKKKVFAFTPEAGSPSDGFWPAANRIEAICAGHTAMNMYLARFALKYAITTEKGPQLLGSFQSTIPIETKCLGIDTPADFTVAIIPLSDNILSVSEPVSFVGMETLETRAHTFGVNLKSGIAAGDKIRFLLATHNGLFAYIDTITKVFGFSEAIFEDNGNSLNHWNSNDWGISTTQFSSPSSSITDSPIGNYINNANTSITLSQPINLSDAISASVEFMARWDVETSWDYVQFMISIDNGSSWTPLAGNYTSTGGSNQDLGKPLYHGTQLQWIKESINLNAYLGQLVQFRFRLISDGSVQRDGFYFDDFTVHKAFTTPVYQMNLPESISFPQRESMQIDLTEYILSEDLSNLTFEWNGNENIDVSISNWVLSIQANEPLWFGNEQITFKLSGNIGYLEQTVSVNCLRVNGVPQIIGQNPISTNKNTPVELSLSNLFVEDDDNNFPNDFSLIIEENQNYTIDNLTINPASDFIGYLTVPVKVNDGEDDSAPYNLQVEVRNPLDEALKEVSMPLIYYSPLQRAIIIEFTDMHHFSSLRAGDMQGRTIYSSSLNGNETKIAVEASNLAGGIYFVQLIGRTTIVKKVAL
jgi:hypothetical protein